MELIRKGSAKDIYRVDKESIAFRFTDRFSVFDCGPHPQEIPGKAEAVCASAVRSFQIAEQIGVLTHFIEQIDEVTIRVREFRIFTDRRPQTWDENYVIPLECITRNRVSGSILRDFRDGKLKPMDFGFPSNDVPTEGSQLPWPVHQLTTKFEPVDRLVSDIDAKRIAGLWQHEIEILWSIIDRLDGALALAFAEAGFAHFDGKKECALGPKRQKLIVDAFGTPDEDRPVLLRSLREEKVEHYGKEFLRQWFIENGFYLALQQARKENRPVPPYPQLPEEIIEEGSWRYVAFARWYEG